MAEQRYVVAGTTRAAIQAQIDAAHRAGGGVVFLPAATYTLDAALRLLPNVRLEGAGPGAVLTLDAGLGPARFDLTFIDLDAAGDTGPHDVEVRNLAIRGPGTSPDLSEEIASDPVDGCGIRSLGRPVRRVVVSGCRIENVSGCGIRFDTRGPERVEDVRIEHCRLFQNRRASEADPVAAAGAKDIYFYGARFANVRVVGNVCAFSPNGTSTHGNDSGIAFVSNGHAGYVRNTYLVHNLCTGHRRHGLLTSYGAMENDGVYATANTCDHNGWAGIYVNADPDAVRRGRIVITGNYCAHNGTGGFLVPDESDATIRGGIVLGASFYTIVSDNICRQNGVPGPVYANRGITAHRAAEHAAGIRVRGTDNVVTGNLVEGNRGDGIVLWPGRASRLSVTNNRVMRNGKSGIYVAGASDEAAEDVTVTANLSTDNRDFGIRCSLAHGVLVASNYVDGNGKDRVGIDGLSRKVVVMEEEQRPGGGLWGRIKRLFD